MGRIKTRFNRVILYFIKINKNKKTKKISVIYILISKKIIKKIESETRKEKIKKDKNE